MREGAADWEGWSPLTVIRFLDGRVCGSFFPRSAQNSAGHTPALPVGATMIVVMVGHDESSRRRSATRRPFSPVRNQHYLFLVASFPRCGRSFCCASSLVSGGDLS